MKRVYLFVAVLAFALATAARPAAAAPAHAPAFAPPVIEREESVNAQAWATQCTSAEDGSEVCTGLNLSVFSPDKSGGTAVCLDVSTAGPAAAAEPDPGNVLYEFGCVGIDISQLALDKDLAWASVELVAVDLYAYVCDGDGKEGDCSETYSRTVTVAASWTASGALGSERLHDEHRQNFCTVDVSGVVLHRSATAVIAFDGGELAGEGMLTTSDTKRKTHCK